MSKKQRLNQLLFELGCEADELDWRETERGGLYLEYTGDIAAKLPQGFGFARQAGLIVAPEGILGLAARKLQEKRARELTQNVEHSLINKKRRQLSEQLAKREEREPALKSLMEKADFAVMGVDISEKADKDYLFVHARTTDKKLPIDEKLEAIFGHAALGVFGSEVGLGVMATAYELLSQDELDASFYENLVGRSALLVKQPMSIIQGIAGGAISHYLFIGSLVQLITASAQFGLRNKRMQGELSEVELAFNQIAAKYHDLKMGIELAMRQSEADPTVQQQLIKLLEKLTKNFQEKINQMRQKLAHQHTERDILRRKWRVTGAVRTANTLLSFGSKFFPPCMLGYTITGAIQLGMHLWGDEAIRNRVLRNQGVDLDSVLLISDEASIQRQAKKCEDLDGITLSFMPARASLPGSTRFLQARVKKALNNIADKPSFILEAPFKIPELGPHVSDKTLEKAVVKYHKNLRWLQAFRDDYNERFQNKVGPRVEFLDVLNQRMEDDRKRLVHRLSNRCSKTRFAALYDKFKGNRYEPIVLAQADLNIVDADEAEAYFKRVINDISQRMVLCEKVHAEFTQGQYFTNDKKIIKEFQKQITRVKVAILDGEVSRKSTFKLQHSIRSLEEQLVSLKSVIVHAPGPIEPARAIQNNNITLALGLQRPLEAGEGLIFLDRSAFGWRKQADRNRSIAKKTADINKPDIFLASSANLSTRNINTVKQLRDSAEGHDTELKYLNDLLVHLEDKNIHIKNIDAFIEKYEHLHESLLRMYDDFRSGQKQTRAKGYWHRLRLKLSNRLYRGSAKRRLEKFKEQIARLRYNAALSQRVERSTKGQSDAGILRQLGVNQQGLIKAKQRLNDDQKTHIDIIKQQPLLRNRPVRAAQAEDDDVEDDGEQEGPRP